MQQIYFEVPEKEAHTAESAFYHPAESGCSDRINFIQCHTNQMFCHVYVKFQMMPCGTSRFVCCDGKLNQCF